MPTLNLEKVPSFYHKYVHQVKQTNLNAAFQQHQKDLVAVLESLPADKWNYKYAPDKWTIKELVQHVIDAERIFSYRALTFARKDDVELPGFDENSYADASKAFTRSAQDLLTELKVVQQSSAWLFHSFNEEQLEESGIANGNPVYVRALGFILIGHSLHHINIIKERYLS